MNAKCLGNYKVASVMVYFVIGTVVHHLPSMVCADEGETDGARLTTTAAADDGVLTRVISEADGEAGGRLIFSTRGDDGELSEKMCLTKDGALAVGTRVPPGYPRAGEDGCLNVIIDNPSRAWGNSYE